MTDKYNLWKLTKLREDDPQAYLDVIISNAALGIVQAIQYQETKVFVISEEQYDVLQNTLSMK